MLHTREESADYRDPSGIWLNYYCKGKMYQYNVMENR